MIMPKYLQYILFFVIISEIIAFQMDPNLNLDYDDIKYLLEVLDDAEASINSPATVSKIPKASLPELTSKQSIDELLHLLLQQKSQIDNLKLINGNNDEVSQQEGSVSSNNDSNGKGSTKSGSLIESVTASSQNRTDNSTTQIPKTKENKGNVTTQTNTVMSVNKTSAAAKVNSTKESQLKEKSNKAKGGNVVGTVVRSGNDDMNSGLLTGDAELDQILSEEIAKLADEMARGTFRIEPPSVTSKRNQLKRPTPLTLPSVRMPQISPLLSSFPTLRNPPGINFQSPFLSTDPLTSINLNERLSSFTTDLKPLQKFSKPKKSSLSTVGMNGVTRGVCKYISKEGMNIEIHFVQQRETSPPTVTKTIPSLLPNPDEYLNQCISLSSSKAQTSQKDSLNYVKPAINQVERANEQAVNWVLPGGQSDQTRILTGFTGFNPVQEQQQQQHQQQEQQQQQQQELLHRQNKQPMDSITQINKDISAPKLLKLKRISDKMKRNAVLRNRYTSNHTPSLEEAKELKLLVESYIVLLLE